MHPIFVPLQALGRFLFVEGMVQEICMPWQRKQVAELGGPLWGAPVDQPKVTLLEGPGVFLLSASPALLESPVISCCRTDVRWWRRAGGGPERGTSDPWLPERKEIHAVDHPPQDTLPPAP